MSELVVLRASELPRGAKKVVRAGETEILLINNNDAVVALQAECPHAGAPLVEGAVCQGRLTCPWHLATFDLHTGEVLEPPAMTSLKSYRVRTESGQIWVSEEPLHPKDSAQKMGEEAVFVLVGMGAAGAIAAVTLRENGFRGRLVAIDPVDDEPVDRTQLSKDGLGGKLPLDKVRLDGVSNIGVERLCTSVTKLNSAQGKIRLDNGMEIDFDKALVATGGKPKRLPVPGAELAHTIRHADDVRKILAVATAGKRVAILGTSFIALEAASALVQSGLAVTVIGREALPFEKQFGLEAAAALKALHVTNGTRFRLGVEIASISEIEITVVEDGREDKIPADVVIMGVGAGPDLGFEHDLPMGDGGCLKAGADLRVGTSVWAAGDIVSVDGQRIEHWRTAQQQGRIAALAMMGRDTSYEALPFFWTYHFGRRFGYLGHANEWDEVHIKGDVAGDEFMVFYLKDDRVAAILNCGFETEMAMLSEPFRRKLTLDEALGICSSTTPK